VTDTITIHARLISGLLSSLQRLFSAEAVRQGWITPPALSASGAPPRNPVMAFDDLKRELDEDRSEQ
jgi:hypothetical protein